MKKQSNKQLILDEYETDIENDFELLKPIDNIKEEVTLLQQAAKNHKRKKKSITIRINELALKAVQLKASKLGIPYQTYINVLIHKSVKSGL
jgi:predicted DNA binding CopG/RHH family protein